MTTTTGDSSPSLISVACCNTPAMALLASLPDFE